LLIVDEVGYIPRQGVGAAAAAAPNAVPTIAAVTEIIRDVRRKVRGSRVPKRTHHGGLAAPNLPICNTSVDAVPHAG
jgi:hypothetical protein